MNLNVRKKEIDLRINTIKREVDEENIELEELSELEKELDELLKERNVIDKKLLLATKFVPPINNDPETNSLMRMEMLESRGKDLREKRAVKVSQEEI
jgi:hypothetical protein